jgi:hypothetical protein
VIEGIYRLTIAGGDYTSGGSPFFFWRSPDGRFSEANANYSSIVFHADPGTGSRRITVYAGVGDRLGRIARIGVALKGNDAK